MTLLPFTSGQLFQIHGSKLKLHPVCHLGQASVLCITHSVLFFGVRKDAFNSLFPLLVKIPVLRCIAGVVRQVLVILPHMPRLFYAVNVRPGQGFPYLQFPLRRDPASRVPASAELILFSYLCKNGYNQFSCYTYIFEITLFIDINQRESACDHIKMRICLHNYAALNACMSRQNTDRINDADILVLFR